MAVVLDEHLLLDVLAGVVSPAVRDEIGDDVLYTTGCWYYRLSRAVLASSGAGSLSGRFATLGSAGRDVALESLRHLPATIGLLSSRTIVPVMAALRVRRPANMLNAEALAVALVVDANIRSRSTQTCSATAHKTWTSTTAYSGSYLATGFCLLKTAHGN